MAEAVAARDLTRRYDGFTAVDHVSFTVREGEVFGFLGPNGAGKTTVIKVLTALLPPSEGTARVAGLDVERDPTGVRRRIGYMSQRFSLYDDLTVDENVTLFGGLYGIPTGRLETRRHWALGMAGLEEQRDRVTGELPLGWKQRLALGTAVLHEPPVLFLDEPTSGVDPVARRGFWDVINELSDAGTTVFVSTHYMEEAENCDRLALLNRGRLIAIDTPRALRHGMKEPIIEIETDAAPRAVELIGLAPGVVEASMFGRKLHVVVEDEARARRELPQILERGGVRVDAIERVPPSLEDVFVALVRRAGGAPAG